MSPFKVIISAIILVRFVFFALPSFNIDMTGWQAWAAKLAEVGPGNFYSENYFSDYFPGYLYILWILGEIYNLIFPSLPFNTFIFEVFIKLTTTFFDLATAFYIFKIVSKYRKSLAYLSAILYLGNPAIIFNSSVWGQVDGIFTFFIIFALYHLVERKKVIKSNFLYALAILIKPQSLALLPIIVKKNLEENPSFVIIKKLAIIPVILIAFSFPFFIYEPISGMLNLAIKASNVYPYNSLFAFNFWSLFGFWRADSNLFLGLTYQLWGFILYSSSLIIVIAPLFRKSVKDNFYFYIASALSVFVFYLFLTRMHERYIFPFFALLLIAALIKKSKILLGIYIITSLIHLLNLWYVYYFYNFVFKGVGETNVIYNFINNNYKILSISLILIFVYLLVIYYRSYFQLLSQK